MLTFRNIMGVVVMAVILDAGKLEDAADEDADQADSNSIVNIKSFYDPTRPAQQKILTDPIFNEVLVPLHNNSKRASWDFYAMIKCGTGCNPLVYKGYGCYCGFLGSGNTVDGIDRCCKMHDWCYTTTTCMILQYNLPYFVPYKWKCNGGSPYCVGTRKGQGSLCSHQLCECDRTFVNCLAQFACPKKKAMCTSPWRYFQNLFMGLGTGMPIDKEHHHLHSKHKKKIPKPYVRPLTKPHKYYP